MASRRASAVFSSSIFTIGLIVIIAVLLFNYWTLLVRNGEVVRQAHALRLELQQATLSNNDSAKKLEVCKADASTSLEKVKKLDEEIKKKETLMNDMIAQLKQSKLMHDSLIEQKNTLSRQLSEVENEKKKALLDLQEEQRKSENNAKSLAKECLDVCQKKLDEAKKDSEKSCQDRLQKQQQLAVTLKPLAASNSTHK